MQPVVTACGSCGELLPVHPPHGAPWGICPVCRLPLEPVSGGSGQRSAVSRESFPSQLPEQTTPGPNLAFARSVPPLLLAFTTTLFLTACAWWLSSRLEAEPAEDRAFAWVLATGGDSVVPRFVETESAPGSCSIPSSSAPLEANAPHDPPPIQAVRIPNPTEGGGTEPAGTGTPPFDREVEEQASPSDLAAVESDGEGPTEAPAPPPPTVVRTIAFQAAEPPSDQTSATESHIPLPAPPRFRIRDESGRSVVARLHGRSDEQTILILPDGQLGIPTTLIPTEEPFRPLGSAELLARLQEGPLGEFQVLKTPHYLIFYRSSYEFADSSGRLLEDLYRRLLDAFEKNGLEVHEAEFPLVAVIYRTEREFRAQKRVDPEIQAFYEIFTNRIFFYESSERDQHAPEITALRKPQTVAHEGTHQILQNIGVHPRLASWPIWLVEGLAEYCATPASSRKGGPVWNGLGMINGLHMATIRELTDPLSTMVPGHSPNPSSALSSRRPGGAMVESLIRKSQLSPTDYALAWAMTHYLAFRREAEFLAYLKTMSRIPPLRPQSADDHLKAFVEAFGSDLAKIDRAIEAHLKKLSRQKGYDPMPFYAVMFEQPLAGGLLRRAAMVSQSPQVIQQWVQEISSPQGDHPTWQALPHPTRARALLAVESWIQGY
jgi:hypothetical protein